MLYYIIMGSEMPSNDSNHGKELLLESLKYVMSRVDPYKAVVNNVRLIDSHIVVGDKVYDDADDVYVAGFGKASCRMAQAVEHVLGERIKEGIVSTKYGYSCSLEKIRVIEAGHPIPDENSVRAGKEIINIVKKAGKKDLVIVLVSGGGSALVEYPADDISINDIAVLNKLLMESGADIHEINTVRKHVTLVKGGWLTTYTGASMTALIISDVVGDDLEVIASGPTVADPTTFNDAYRILEFYNLWNRIPESIRRYIEKGLKGEAPETPKKVRENVYNEIIASSRIACEAAQEWAIQNNIKSYILTTELTGEAREVGNVLASIMKEIKNYNRPFEKPCLIFACGETTVTLGEKYGKGGPNQELALSIAINIRGIDGLAALSIDTDGTDGPTDVAGGIVDHTTYDKIRSAGIDPAIALKDHDSYNALSVADALVKTGPTLTNVNSFVALYVYK